jgi:uncharacterized protein (DUF305 family)
LRHGAEFVPARQPENLTALAAASGAKFDPLWLEGMIYHHEGALEMARTQKKHQFETGRRPYGTDVLVDEILVVQRADYEDAGVAGGIVRSGALVPRVGRYR